LDHIRFLDNIGNNFTVTSLANLHYVFHVSELRKYMLDSSHFVNYNKENISFEIGFNMIDDYQIK